MSDEKCIAEMMTEGGSNRRAGCHRFFRSGLSRPNFRSPALTKVATCSACEQVSWLGPPCCSPPGGRSCCGASQGRQATSGTFLLPQGRGVAPIRDPQTTNHAQHMRLVHPFVWPKATTGWQGIIFNNR
jgi:hypothetical protein